MIFLNLLFYSFVFKTRPYRWNPAGVKNLQVVRVHAVLGYLVVLGPLLSFLAAVRVHMTLYRLISLLYVLVVPVPSKDLSVLNASSHVDHWAQFALHQCWLLDVFKFNQHLFSEFYLGNVQALVKRGQDLVWLCLILVPGRSRNLTENDADPFRVFGCSSIVNPRKLLSWV